VTASLRNPTHNKRRSGGRSISVMALLCIACGGAPFSMLGSTIDAGADTVTSDAPLMIHYGDAAIWRLDAADVEASTEADDGLRGSDAATVDASTSDANVDVDSSTDSDSNADSSPTCAPIPRSGYQCGIVGIDVPAYFCLVNPPRGPNKQTYVSTPAECQCVGAYTCACLFAHAAVVCADGGAPSCVEMPHLTMSCP
jgi:hypothetical protein